MDKKSKILLVVFFLIIAVSAGVTFWKILIQCDYIVEAQTDCDPTTEKCYVHVCSLDVDGECTGDADEDTTYYKIVERKAANIPECDPNDENCKALICEEGEKDCSETLCSEETAIEGDECNDPEQYNAEHPADEEGDANEQCDPESEDCSTSINEESLENAGDENIDPQEINQQDSSAQSDQS